MLAGLLILIWSSTVTDKQRQLVNWWNGDAKLAVTVTIVTVSALALAILQQWTLFSFQGSDDRDQGASRSERPPGSVAK